jgi:MSHA biogenesis protein MshJ
LGVARVQALVARYKDLSGRERLLLGLAVVAVSYFAIDAWLLTPQLERRDAIAARAKDRQLERSTLLALLAGPSTNTQTNTSTNPSNEPDPRAALLDTVNQGKRLVLEAGQQEAVGPLLRKLVASAPGLELTALRTSAATVFYQTPPPAKTTPSTTTTTVTTTAAADAPVARVELPTLYVKSVEASVNGNYLDLLGYLQALESHPQTLYWDAASVTVGAYPAANLRLVLKVLTTSPDALTTGQP